MKKTIFAFVLALLPLAVQAQSQEETPKHQDFVGIPIQGSIEDFTNSMASRFRLKKKMASDNQYIFEGPLFGYNVLVQANYSRKSHTVYRLLVTPKNINQYAWQDSLQVHYGEPQETDRGLLYRTDGGMVLFYTPEGYDSALIFLDSAGNEAFSKEK